MKLMTLLAPVLVLALAAPAPAFADKTAAQLTADRIAAAKHVLDFDDVAKHVGVAMSPEERYRWSVRLVDAQLDDPAQAKTALADHAKRMTALRDPAQVGHNTGTHHGGRGGAGGLLQGRSGSLGRTRASLTRARRPCRPVRSISARS